YEVTHAITIDVVSKPDLRLYLVAFGDGNLSHVVAEPAILSALPVAPRQRGAQPRLHARVDGRILPVAHHYLAAQTHARHNKPELAVAVCALVQVHKVHINGLPGNILVELRVQVKQRFVQNLKTPDPHPGWREGVHPGNESDAVAGVIRFPAKGCDLFRRLNDGLEDDLY